MTKAPAQSPIRPKLKKLAALVAKREQKLTLAKQKLAREMDKDRERQNGFDPQSGPGTASPVIPATA